MTGIPEHGWTCFHCGATFKLAAAARNHFGFEPGSAPACRIKGGAELGLVMALRRAEQEAADAWAALHNESSDFSKAYYRQTTRHQEQLRLAEEAGYERGLHDGRNLKTEQA